MHKRNQFLLGGSTHLLIFAVVLFASRCHSVGLNCSDADCDEEERRRCPVGSVYVAGGGDGGQCVCHPEKCQKPPLCPFPYRLELIHKATKEPGDCCDVTQCAPKETNCTGVVCKEEDSECPKDSYRLPGRLSEGDCCSMSQGCQCEPACPEPPPCPKGQTPYVATRGTGQPGSCCPKYTCQPQQSNTTCLHEGKEYSEGVRWKVSECNECRCTNGSVYCSDTVKCPPVPPACTSTAKPRDQCCPVCKEGSFVKPGGCKSGSGVIHENGARWQEDDCTSCTCLGGLMKCQAAMCQHSCQNPTFVKGECCPRCDPTPEEECKLECPGGYSKDADGKTLCECSSTVTAAPPPKEAGCPPLKNCHKTCKYGFKRNEAGCKLCRCEHCKPIAKCTKRCPHGLRTDRKGCPSCKCRAFQPVSAGVNKTVEEKNGKDCRLGDEVRDDGEAWYDGCRQCYCLGGKEMCALVSCPKPDCIEPVMSKNSCCPTCPAGKNGGGEGVGGVSEGVCQSVGGGVRREGEWWELGVGCVSCVCQGGRALCHRPACPPAPCIHPMTPSPPDNCCQLCPAPLPQPLPDEQGCGEGRPAGSSWRQGSCVSCTCNNGTATCFTENCEQKTNSNCRTPVQIKNQCCPICLDDGIPEEETCTVGNTTYAVGEVWHPEECKRCTCEPGRIISCVRRICQTPCSISPCCLKCPGGMGEEKEWSERAWYLGVLCVVMFLLGGVTMMLWRHCCPRRHQLKLAQCQSPPMPYQYKYVPTFESPPHHHHHHPHHHPHQPANNSPQQQQQPPPL